MKGLQGDDPRYLANCFAGDEVAQLYVKHLDSKVDRPPLEKLKGFTRVHIAAGSSRNLTIPLNHCISAL